MYWQNAALSWCHQHRTGPWLPPPLLVLVVALINYFWVHRYSLFRAPPWRDLIIDELLTGCRCRCHCRCCHLGGWRWIIWFSHWDLLSWIDTFVSVAQHFLLASPFASSSHSSSQLYSHLGAADLLSVEIWSRLLFHFHVSSTFDGRLVEVPWICVLAPLTSLIQSSGVWVVRRGVVVSTLRDDLRPLALHTTSHSVDCWLRWRLVRQQLQLHQLDAESS